MTPAATPRARCVEPRAALVPKPGQQLHKYVPADKTDIRQRFAQERARIEREST